MIKMVLDNGYSMQSFPPITSFSNLTKPHVYCWTILKTDQLITILFYSSSKTCILFNLTVCNESIMMKRRILCQMAVFNIICFLYVLNLKLVFQF